MERVLKGRYRFVQANAIGRGSFSKVYAGIDLQTDLRVAIKKIHLRSIDDKIRTRLDDEIRILRSIDHPNIVKTYDVETDEDSMYIIMEYCTGGDFSKFVARSPLRESKVRYYIYQLMKGLAYLRERHILHRDLKPANLLLTDENRIIKIADFGFAKVIGESTLMETMCGSPLYMAPEIIGLVSGETYTEKSDLWSIGVMLYQCLYGRLVFGEISTYDELVKAIRTTPVVYPKNIHVSAECLDLLMGLLQKEPTLRFTWVEFFTHRWWDTRETSISPLSSLDSTDLWSRRPPPAPSQYQAPQVTPAPQAPQVTPAPQASQVTLAPQVTLPIPITQPTQNLSISLSPQIIDSYIISRSPPFSTISSVPPGRHDTHGSIPHIREPNQHHNENNLESSNETYVRSIWGFLSSSLKTLSMFKGK